MADKRFIIQMEQKTEHADSQTCLAIIAGGKGTRLGGAVKGLLRVEGRSLLERILDMRSHFAEALLVADDPIPYRSYGLRFVEDRHKGRGAPGGVHAALAAARAPWVFAVGCDMPFVQWPVVAALLDARAPTVDLVCFEVHGRFEPLLGVYRSCLADRWGELLPTNPSFREVFSHFRARVLPQSRLLEVDPDLRSPVSINTPADLARWKVETP